MLDMMLDDQRELRDSYKWIHKYGTAVQYPD
jgi:hypothetical protein